MARRSPRASWLLRTVWAGAVLARGAMADNILQTVGFSNCNANTTVTVQRVDIVYNNDNQSVTFDVAGSNAVEQNVTAILNVTAYGSQIYANSFDPCAAATFVQQLCPLPAGDFSATGTQAIPAQFASLVPSIAFQVPDIEAMATLQLMSKDSGAQVACIESQVSNGKTTSVPAVSYVAAGIAGAALVMGTVSAVSAALSGGSGAAAAGGAAGAALPSPSFTEVAGWMQGMAMNGMLSVNYPSVYRSFAKNFGFSTGLIPWVQLQMSIDSFRAATGGNLTNDNVQFLSNATLVFADGSTDTLGASGSTTAFRRAVAVRLARDISTSVNATTAAASSGGNNAVQSIRVAVSGIQAYVEELSIPSASTFMTVLLIVAIVIAAIAAGILLVKVVLEFWALFGHFPQSLAGFRKHYWGSIARAITSLILLLYGVWVLYCIFQFTNGDSWAAKILAAVTLALFTGVLAYFSWQIWRTARMLKASEGDIGGLYENKNIWVKYSLFYESYRRDYWWIFVPTILYMFAKGCILAAADGHGAVQTIAQLAVEVVMLVLLLWSRPYERRSGNVVNIVIQVVRVLSVVCVLIFVEEFGITQTTQTVTGVVLIAVQSAMTGVLAILIAWNAITSCCKQNPHRKRRKEMEKLQQDMDNLTPLDAHNSLLFGSNKNIITSSSMSDSMSLNKMHSHIDEEGDLEATAGAPGVGSAYARQSEDPYDPYQPFASRRQSPPRMPFAVDNNHHESLVMGAAPPAVGGNGGHNHDDDARQPTLPDLGGAYPLGGPAGGGVSSNNESGYGHGPGRPYTGLSGKFDPGRVLGKTRGGNGAFYLGGF